MAGRHRVGIPRQVQVDILLRDDLGPPPTGSSALDAEDGPERWLAEGDDCAVAKPAEPHGQPDRCGGFPLAQRRRIDGCHQHIAGPWPVRQPIKAGQGHLRFPSSIGNQFVRSKAKTLANLDDGTRRH